MKPLKAVALAALGTFLASSALAYGPDGHHTVGALARELIKGTRAETEVTALLGDIDLSDAAVWADCAKGVDQNFKYHVTPNRYPECRVFETPQREPVSGRPPLRRPRVVAQLWRRAGSPVAVAALQLAGATLSR